MGYAHLAMRALLLAPCLGSLFVVSLVCCTGDDPAYVPVSSDQDAAAGVDAASGVDARAPAEDAGSSGDAAVDASPEAGGPKQAFVTRGAWTGAMVAASGGGGTNGLSGADAHCMAEAAADFPGRTFHAYLSTNTVDASAASRLGTGPWYVGAARLGDVAAIVGGALETALDKDSAGATVASGVVWTGTEANGTKSTDGTCAGWTTAASGQSARVGLAGAADYLWVANSYNSCDATRRLYCFEY